MSTQEDNDPSEETPPPQDDLNGDVQNDDIVVPKSRSSDDDVCTAEEARQIANKFNDPRINSTFKRVFFQIRKAAKAGFTSIDSHVDQLDPGLIGFRKFDVWGEQTSEWFRLKERLEEFGFKVTFNNATKSTIISW